ncbi:MAG TPA: hypothetical protein VFN13_13365 [Rudaea sp.]|nr:hypothetical protein [Rudaea sp.]
MNAAFNDIDALKQPLGLVRNESQLAIRGFVVGAMASAYCALWGLQSAHVNPTMTMVALVGLSCSMGGSLCSTVHVFASRLVNCRRQKRDQAGPFAQELLPVD